MDFTALSFKEVLAADFTCSDAAEKLITFERLEVVWSPLQVTVGSGRLIECSKRSRFVDDLFLPLSFISASFVSNYTIILRNVEGYL
jgi:hypothetical protein